MLNKTAIIGFLSLLLAFSCTNRSDTNTEEECISILKEASGEREQEIRNNQSESYEEGLSEQGSILEEAMGEGTSEQSSSSLEADGEGVNERLNNADEAKGET